MPVDSVKMIYIFQIFYILKRFVYFMYIGILPAQNMQVYYMAD